MITIIGLHERAPVTATPLPSDNHGSPHRARRPAPSRIALRPPVRPYHGSALCHSWLCLLRFAQNSVCGDQTQQKPQGARRPLLAFLEFGVNHFIASSRALRPWPAAGGLSPAGLRPGDARLGLAI